MSRDCGLKIFFISFLEVRSHSAASSSFCSWGWLWISNPPACTSQELESQGQKPELPSWKTSSPPNELHPLLTFFFYWSKSLEHKSEFYLHNSLALVIFITLNNYTAWLPRLCVGGMGEWGWGVVGNQTQDSSCYHWDTYQLLLTQCLMKLPRLAWLTVP